jgi:drug/metabolite transporter (DMT)-like permease
MVLVAFFWGGAFNAAKFALSDISPLTAAFFRFALTALILLPFSFRELARTKLKSRDWLDFFLLGLTGVFGYNVFFLVGMQTTSPINGSLIVSASPMVTTLLAFPILREKIAAGHLGGILLSFGGVCLVVSGGSLRSLLSLQVNRGDLLMLGAMLSWSLYAIVGKKVMGRRSPVVSTSYGIAAGTLLLLPFALFGDPGFGSLAGAGWPAFSAILYLSVFASVLGFLWWNRGVSFLGAGRASVFLNLIPVATMVISLFFRDPIVLSQIAGCVLIIGGVTMTARQKNKVELAGQSLIGRMEAGNRR